MNKSLYASTGCTLFDLTVGGGMGMGFPYGRIINLVGDKSSGKTFLAHEIIAQNYYRDKKKFQWIYDDCEHGSTFGKEIFGINIISEDAEPSHTIEELDAHINRFSKDVPADKYGVYVIDSLDGLSNEEIEKRSDDRLKIFEGKKKDDGKGTYGMKTPKFLSQEFFRTKAGQVYDKNVMVIFVSQVRENIDSFTAKFNKHVRSGGKALDHYSHTVVWLSTVRKIYREKVPVGLVVKAKTSKSKTPRPFRECVFSLYFDYGIDNIGSNLDYLFNLRGDNGLLVPERIKNIIWDKGTPGKPLIEKNLKNLKAFLTEHEHYKPARRQRKADEGNPELSIKYILTYMENIPELKKAAGDTFGNGISRDDLIKQIESDSKMEKQLEQRVVDKWEQKEASIKTNRKRKYGG